MRFFRMGSWVLPWVLLMFTCAAPSVWAVSGPDPQLAGIRPWSAPAEPGVAAPLNSQDALTVWTTGDLNPDPPAAPPSGELEADPAWSGILQGGVQYESMLRVHAEPDAPAADLRWRNPRAELPPPVPEPTALVLLGSGLGLTGFALARRRRSPTKA